MGRGTEQAIRIRRILADRREKLGRSQQEVADAVAREIGKDSLSKQAISQWERFESQPGVDQLAGWARALGLRLSVEIVDPEDRRVSMPVRPDLVEVVSRLHDLSAGDLELITGLVRRFTPDRLTE
jgi:transcriptional regulator with XRE-family HTH domain